MLFVTFQIFYILQFIWVNNTYSLTTFVRISQWYLSISYSKIILFLSHHKSYHEINSSLRIESWYSLVRYWSLDEIEFQFHKSKKKRPPCLFFANVYTYTYTQGRRMVPWIRGWTLVLLAACLPALLLCPLHLGNFNYSPRRVPYKFE